jgi:hypothetical protein
VIEWFVDKLLTLVDTYRMARGELTPGQTLWPAVALDEHPGYRKSLKATRQVPVVVTVANQDDIAALRNKVKQSQVLKRALARAAKEAYAQGGVLTVTDLALLFHRSHSRTAELIREHEAETGQVVPRRGNLHDMGRTVSHKRIICRKAYLEGKLTHVIARETFHSPEAVDHYILDFARVYFATVQQRMTPEEAAFATQRPHYLVAEYVKMIEEFGLDEQRVYDRVGGQISTSDSRVQQPGAGVAGQSERREQDPIAAWLTYSRLPLG